MSIGAKAVSFCGGVCFCKLGQLPAIAEGGAVLWRGGSRSCRVSTDLMITTRSGVVIHGCDATTIPRVAMARDMFTRSFGWCGQGRCCLVLEEVLAIENDDMSRGA